MQPISTFFIQLPICITIASPSSSLIPIVAALISVFIAALIGAWINNIFTYKIKDKIENLDQMYKNLFKIRDFAMEIHDRAKDVINNYSLTKDYRNDMTDLMRSSIMIMGDRYKIQLKEIDEGIVCALGRDSSNKIRGIISVDFYEKIECLLETIIRDRKEITSFYYMLKQLNPIKCNKNLTTCPVNKLMQSQHNTQINSMVRIILFLVIAVFVLWVGEFIILKFFDKSNMFYKYKSIVDYKLFIATIGGVDVVGVISNFVLGFYFVTIDLEATQRMPKNILRVEETFYWLIRAFLLSLILAIYAALPFTDIQKLITSMVIILAVYFVMWVLFTYMYKYKAVH